MNAFALMEARAHPFSLASKKTKSARKGANLFPPPVAEEGKRICCAAVEKIEEKRKSDDFFGHRKRTNP